MSRIAAVHKGALPAFQGAQHQLDRELAAILTPADQFDPGADLLGQGVFVGSQIVGDEALGEALGNDGGDLLAQQLVAGISELPLGLEVQEDDVTPLVDDHHAVGRRLQQAAIARLHPGEMVFGGLSNADVADRRRHQYALVTFQGAQHKLDRKLAAVLASSDELDPRADLLGQGVGGRAQVVGDETLGEALGDDVGDLLSEQLVAGISELPFGLEVEQDDVPSLVDHHHSVRRRFEESAVSALRARQVPFGFLADGRVAHHRCRREAVLAGFHFACLGCAAPSAESIAIGARSDALARSSPASGLGSAKIIQGDRLERRLDWETDDCSPKMLNRLSG